MHVTKLDNESESWVNHSFYCLQIRFEGWVSIFDLKFHLSFYWRNREKWNGEINFKGKKYFILDEYCFIMCFFFFNIVNIGNLKVVLICTIWIFYFYISFINIINDVHMFTCKRNLSTKHEFPPFFFLNE